MFRDTGSTVVSDYLVLPPPKGAADLEMGDDVVDERVEIGVPLSSADNRVNSLPQSKVGTPLKADRGDVGLSKLPRAQKRSCGDTPFKSRVEKMNE